VSVDEVTDGRTIESTAGFAGVEPGGCRPLALSGRAASRGGGVLPGAAERWSVDPFAGLGARTTTILNSLIETAKLNGIDPAAYLLKAAEAALAQSGAVTLP
jgi:hypothetical protein